MSRIVLAFSLAMILFSPVFGFAEKRPTDMNIEISDGAAPSPATADPEEVLSESKAFTPAKTLLSLQVADGRAVLEADGDLSRFKYFELTGPARLVLDIFGVVPGFEQTVFPTAAGFKVVRIGRYPEKSRVILDAAGPVLPAYTLRQRGRMIEVTWQTAAAPMTAGGAEVVAGALEKGEPGSVPSAKVPADLEKLRQFLESEQVKLAQLQQQFSEEEAKYLAYRQQLERSMAEQQRRIEEMQAKLGLTKPAEARPAAPAAPAGESPPPTAAQAAGKEDKVGQPPARPVGQPPEKEREQTYKEIEAIFERQGVLTPRGKIVLEPSLQYSYLSSTRVALVGYTIIPAITIGLIDVRSVNRNTFVGALAARYGLTNRLELELKIPYVYRDDSTTAQSLNVNDPNEDVFNADGNDIGDIEFGFRYQFNMPKSNGPIFIGGLRVKADTGTDPFEVPIDPETGLPLELATGSGFWGIQPSLTAIFPSDPAVFFGSVSYLYNIDRDVSGIGKVELGDTIGFNFGVGYGINEKSSFSLGYEHNVILKTKFDGDRAPGSLTNHVGSLLLGGAYRLTENTNLNVSLSGGLTEAAPDVQLTVRVPITF